MKKLLTALLFSLALICTPAAAQTLGFTSDDGIVVELTQEVCDPSTPRLRKGTAKFPDHVRELCYVIENELVWIVDDRMNLVVLPLSAFKALDI